ncbi:MAG: glycosyltransferase family 2 protein [Planctomycetota bacterium]|nr:glycosyltransferase family 2 protein [Planctomycetota bacterium]
MSQLQTPIAFCVFNRPEVTERVFCEIAKQRPRHLLVIADGPRPQHPGDAEKTARTRDVINKIDWPCDLRTCFAEQNMGCGKRMATGLTWAFEQFHELIILEDDCLPHPSFFGFCEQLLDRYRETSEVMMISGDNFQPAPVSEQSYYFSKWPHIWGWASWQPAWQAFLDTSPPQDDRELAETLSRVHAQTDEIERWTSILRDYFQGKIDTWDFQWMYAIWKQRGLTVLPNLNLISNLGFGPGATHTLDENSWLAELETHELINLKHPSQIEADSRADRWTFENIMQLNGMPEIPASKSPPTAAGNWLTRFLKSGSRSSLHH